MPYVKCINGANERNKKKAKKNSTLNYSGNNKCYETIHVILINASTAIIIIIIMHYECGGRECNI